MTAEAPAPALSLQELRNAAELLEREGVASGALDPAALDAERPAATAAGDDAGAAWFQYVCTLARRCGEGAAPARAARPLAQVLHEALAETPVRVRLGSGTDIHIYAKSLDTLLFLEALDADLRTVQDQLLEVLDAEARGELSAAQTEFLASLLNRLALRLFVWVLSTAGPGLPFSEGETEPQPPEWTKVLTAEDVGAIMRAHLQLNREDLAFLADAFPSERRPDGSRLPLSGFLGALAHEWGLPARQVMAQWTLRGLYAQAIVAAQSQRDAHAAAERDRARRAGQG